MSTKYSIEIVQYHGVAIEKVLREWRGKASVIDSCKVVSRHLIVHCLAM